LCYATGKELEKFTKNKLAKHTQLAHQYWRRLRGMLESMFGSIRALNSRSIHFYEVMEREGLVPYLAEDTDPIAIRERARPRIRSFFSQVLAFEGKYSWFKLSPSTSRIVNAFDSLIVKVPGRIKDKKDIGAVAEVFFNLASYLYTTIPELSNEDGRGRDNSDDRSETALLSFVEAIEPLSAYFAERQPLEGKDKVKSKVVLLSAWIFGLFVSENQVVKFFAWWVMVQLLTFGGVAVAFHYVPNLKPELIISIVLPTPLVVAAAALAAPLRNKP
jgi:hypothetical protein